MEGRPARGGCCGWFLVLLAALVIGLAIFFTFGSKHENFDLDPYNSVSKRYENALKIAMQFFDVQKSGKLGDNNKIKWRGDSGVEDGNKAKLDLSKGMYDAGDHMKFGFPMAFTATVLSWAILEYGGQMKTARQLEPAHESLKWITDYLINANPKANILYIQVGDPEIDHKCWNRPEDMTEARPLTMVNTSSPGSDVAAETAAAMASASLVFKSTDSKYSGDLLEHAQKLFTFADKHRAMYSKKIKQVQKYYNSTGYGDELLWAASWLYHATGDQTYLDYVTGKNGQSFAKWGKTTWFSWDDKLPGTHVLLSRVSFFGSNEAAESLNKYKETAEAIMCSLIPGSPTATENRTDSGLIWLSEWNALQHPVAISFLAVLYSDYMVTSHTTKITCSGDTSFTPGDLRKFATTQAEYVLGKNPNKMSYLVGYGEKYPKFVHHRGASIPADEKANCTEGWKWMNSSDPNPNVAVGALVGGPYLNESYMDTRNNSMQGEPSTYNSALLVGLLSGLITTSPVARSFT